MIKDVCKESGCMGRQGWSLYSLAFFMPQSSPGVASSPRWTRKHRFYVTRVIGPVRICITSQRTVPSAPALRASRTSSRPPGPADRGRWHRSRVPRVLVRAPRPSAVVSSRGLLRRHCAALAAPRGRRTSRPMLGNVRQRCGAHGRRIHVCQTVSPSAR